MVFCININYVNEHWSFKPVLVIFIIFYKKLITFSFW